MQRTYIDFGIDLGTTNSTIAVIDNIDAKVIPNKVGSVTTPSAVWIDKRGTLRVGLEAKGRAAHGDEKNVAFEFKLKMGSGDEANKKFEHSDREMSPEELSAEILKSLKADVQTSSGEELRAAVITVPAAFENSQTNATREAAKLAGFVASPLLLEPIAASLAYGFQSESENVYWFVYDFGGGTFDAAVMRIRDGLIQVVNHDGDNFLGGKLIDWDIVSKKLVPWLSDEFNLPEFHRGNASWKSEILTLKYHAEMAKIEVCRNKAPVEIYVENLCTDADGKEVDLTYTLTPEDLQEISAPYIEQSLALCKKALKESGLQGSDMERVLMVGGTTLNPWVREAVEHELGCQMEYSIDPVTVVARGAAIFASTQALPEDVVPDQPAGTYRIKIEHKPVGNIADPYIGGRVTDPQESSVNGYTIELVDAKTQWRSGRTTLGEDGVFMTQLYAENQRRHRYDIELYDTTGSRVGTYPDHVSYTLGCVPESPPATMTIGVGTANGGVATYVNKGDKLPCRKTLDHYTTLHLEAGNANDQLRIPLLEGEHSRAERNHGIGAIVISGSDISRDLPSGSLIEITVLMDEHQEVRLQAYVTSLDMDIPELRYNSEMQHSSLDELTKEAEQQKKRLHEARTEADNLEAGDAGNRLTQIDELEEAVDRSIAAASEDSDAITEVDRKLRELGARIDEVEDSVEWPKMLEEAEQSRSDAEAIVEQYGKESDESQFRELETALRRAFESGDNELLRRCIDDLDVLRVDILNKLPEFHVARFEWLADQRSTMRDPAQADQIISMGRRSINNNDIGALQAANRQLVSLLPKTINEPKHVNIGTTNVMH